MVAALTRQLIYFLIPTQFPPNNALALAREPDARLKAEDIVDDRLVVELDKEGFIDRIYK